MLYGNNQDANSVRANVQLVTRVRFAVLQSLYFQVYPTQGSIVLGGNQQFQFDYVLPFDCPQHVIYKSFIEPSVNVCFEGYNIPCPSHNPVTLFPFYKRDRKQDDQVTLDDVQNYRSNLLQLSMSKPNTGLTPNKVCQIVPQLKKLLKLQLSDLNLSCCFSHSIPDEVFSLIEILQCERHK